MSDKLYPIKSVRRVSIYSRLCLWSCGLFPPLALSFPGLWIWRMVPTGFLAVECREVGSTSLFVSRWNNKKHVYASNKHSGQRIRRIHRQFTFIWCLRGCFVAVWYRFGSHSAPSLLPSRNVISMSGVEKSHWILLVYAGAPSRTQIINKYQLRRGEGTILSPIIFGYLWQQQLENRLSRVKVTFKTHWGWN